MDNNGSNKYPVAVEVKVKYILPDGSQDIDTSDRYKGLVNKENDKQLFAIVGAGYKVAQHDEVEKTIIDTVESQKIRYELKSMLMNEGARLYTDLIFPDLKIDMNGQGNFLNMRVTFDNSYDQTTGLRLNIGAFIPATRTIIYLGESFSMSYQRHTKGMNVSNLAETIQKGVNTFQNKVRREFESMVATKVDIVLLREWCRAEVQAKEDSTDYQLPIPAKYFTMIKNSFDRTTITNVWEAYSLVCGILTLECDESNGEKRMSVDRFKQLSYKMLSTLKHLSANATI